MSNIQDNSHDKYLVTQSNRLIEADYSNANLPARTMKIARLIVAKISPDDKEFRLITIKNTAIKQYLGYKNSVPYNRFHTDLDDICKRLNEEPIRIRTEADTILNAFFISSWEINFKEGHTTFEISGRLKKYLLELKQNYTSYQLKNIPKLNSSYSIRMYELLYQYKSIGKRKFELEDLKNKIGCSYNLYGHFKKKALEKAQIDLVNNTDIRFEYEELKTGRKVTSLIIYIYPNNPKQNDPQGVLAFLEEEERGGESKGFPQHIFKAMISLGISASAIEKNLALGFDIIKDEDSRKAAKKRCKTIDVYYLEKLTLLEQSKGASNPAGFLINAIKQDWKSPRLLQTVKSDTKRKQQRAAKQHIIKLEAKEAKLLKQYEEQKQTIFDDIIKDNDAEFLKVYNSIEDNHSVIKYKKAGLSPMENYKNSIFLRIKMNEILAEPHKALFREVDSLYQHIEEIRQEVATIKKQWKI
ncbi:MAG: replication initiation protein [Bacteroidota bacterium]